MHAWIKYGYIWFLKQITVNISNILDPVIINNNIS